MSLVNHPKHYNQGQIEVIDAIEDWKLGFNDGNAVKYVARHRHKGTPIQDVEKAIWYLNRLLGEMVVPTERERLLIVLRNWLGSNSEKLDPLVGAELGKLLDEIDSGYYASSH